MKDLGLEVETLEKPMYVSSPLGTRVSVDQICRGCELEISGIVLTVDLRVIDMSEFDLILGMVHHRRVIAYTPDGNHLCLNGISTMLYPKPCTTLDGTGS